ncbi:hypothetical protein Tco_1275456 [Tanacetum coccineum]
MDSREQETLFCLKTEAIFLLLNWIADGVNRECRHDLLVVQSICDTVGTRWLPSASTRHKGKEIAKPVTPQSESVSEEDSDPEQAQRDKECKRIWLSLQSISKNSTQAYQQQPSRTSSNSRNRLKIPHQGNQGCAIEWDYSALNAKGFWALCNGMHDAKAGLKNKYHKEKMMMCKQAEQGVPLQAEQADWLADTDEVIDEQELEARFSVMAKDSGRSLPEKIPVQLKSLGTEVDSNVTPDS